VCAGARALLDAGQSGSGADLCLLLIEVYKAAQLAPDAVSKSRLIELITIMPPEEPSRKRFINEIVAWTMKFGEFPAGDPEIHHFVGNIYAQEDDIYEAEKHLVLGTRESPDVLARMLYAWYTEDEPRTAPNYIARAIFSYLLVGNLREASRSLHVFIQQMVHDHPELVVQQVQSPAADFRVFPSLPLLNFLGLLELAARAGGAEVFRSLRAHYASQLNEVPAWEEALEQIGDVYFGIQIRRQANIFDMMGSMFGAAPEPQRRAPEITDSLDFD